MEPWPSRPRRPLLSWGARPLSDARAPKRQSARAPMPSLRPFNQARSGHLGIRQGERQQARRRDLKIAGRRWSAIAVQVLVRYRCANATATRSTPEKGLEAELEQTRG